MRSTGTEIVVGIDFGTTYSGVSWAVNEGQKRIRLITDWANPNAINSNADKVPSVISYQNSAVQHWGYEVPTKNEAFRWAKILLEPEENHAGAERVVQDCAELLRKTSRTAEDVVCDYFRQIWAYTKEDIRKRVGDDEWERSFTVLVILTVPAMWSHVAKDRTLKAAKAAGLPPSITLVTEPEAAALATLRDKADDATLQTGDVFVVCDAGGGTVDLISYKVNNVEPLEVEECAIGEDGRPSADERKPICIYPGHLCGSVYLDAAFEQRIITLVGEEHYQKIKPRHRMQMMNKFDMGVKRCFTLDSTADYCATLYGVEDNEEEGIIDGDIPLKPNFLRAIFDQVCNQIDNLVQNQVDDVKRNGLAVKSILLVGGFGSSKYLHRHLENTFSTQKITVLQIDGAWSAISRGACMWGLEHVESLRVPFSSSLPAELAATTATRPLTVVSRLSKYSYGIVVSVPFDMSFHLWKDRFLDQATGRYMAANQMQWLLRRGDRVVEGRLLNISVIQTVHGVKWLNDGGSRQFASSLMVCDSDEPPTRKNETVKELCSVEYEIPECKIWGHEKSYKSPVMPGKWRNAKIDLHILLGGATLEYMVAYHGETMGSVEAKYAGDS